MSLGLVHWKGRRKSTLRCYARDLRVFSPLIGVAFCVLSSAMLIFAAERLGVDLIDTLAQTPEIRATTPLEGLDDVYLTISSNSTSNASAAPPGIRPVPRFP